MNNKKEIPAKELKKQQRILEKKIDKASVAFREKTGMNFDLHIECQIIKTQCGNMFSIPAATINYHKL